MAIITTLNTLFTAETTSFDKGINSSQKRVSGFGDAVGGVSPRLTSFGQKMMAMTPAALGVTAAIGAVVLAFKAVKAAVNIAVKATQFFIDKTRSQFEPLDNLAKQIERSGVDAESFQALAFGAKLAGVEVGGLDKSVFRFSRSMGDAIKGTGEQAEAFEKLELRAKDLIRLPVGEQLAAVADKFAGLSLQTDKATVAQALFGRQGADLIPLLDQGAAGLAASRAELERLGGVFSRADLAQIEAANDAFTKLQTTFDAFFQRAAIEVAPFVKVISEDLTTAWIKVSGVLEAMPEKMESFIKRFRILDTLAGGFANKLLVAAKIQAQQLQLVARHKALAGVLGSVLIDQDEADAFMDLLNELSNLDLGKAGTDLVSRVEKEKLAQMEAAQARVAATEKARLAELKRLSQEAFAAAFTKSFSEGIQSAFGVLDTAAVRFGDGVRGSLTRGAESLLGFIDRADVTAGSDFKNIGAIPNAGALQRGSLVEFQARAGAQGDPIKRAILDVDKKAAKRDEEKLKVMREGRDATLSLLKTFGVVK